MLKRRPIHKKKQEQVNIKALIWIGATILVIVVVMAVLLTMNR
ncbi:MAG: hypothetical protein JWM44_2959 [Bacilli bacterium]|nr:hypothetical protein [Bacilli bacterium]